MSKDEGYILWHRKARHNWKYQDPQFRSAWNWILTEAEWRDFNGLKRGQVRFSLSQAKELWGMSKKKALVFLNRCVQDGSITWEKGKPGRPNKLVRAPFFAPINAPINAPISGTITVLKYNNYQPCQEGGAPINAPCLEMVRVPLTNKKSTKNNTEKRREEPSSSKIKWPKKAPKDPREINECLGLVDLDALREKYGAVVDQEWPRFMECAIEGTDKKVGRNPYNWKDFQKACRNWIDRKLKWEADRNQPSQPMLPEFKD